MIENSRHTKEVLENKNYFQCYFNNVGFCKYRKHCKYQHFTEICQKPFCRDKKCKFRHSKTCKYGEKCGFFQKKRCVYNHYVARSKNDEEAEKLKNEVKNVEDQILNLKKQVEEKQEVLKEITDIKNTQNKMIIDMKEENSKFKKEFSVKGTLSH